MVCMKIYILDPFLRDHFCTTSVVFVFQEIHSRPWKNITLQYEHDAVQTHHYLTLHAMTLDCILAHWCKISMLEKELVSNIKERLPLLLLV